ncbi:MAG TPA: ABC transporter permease [Bryobacteraceae bacterium]
MSVLWNDIRYGLRMLAANPGFTAVAIVSLAVGIGANTSMFSLADAMLLRPLPVARPAEMVRVVSTSPSVPFGGISYRDYVDFRDRSKTLSALVASSNIPLGFNPNPNAPAQIRLGLAVTPDFFDALGVQPALGRGFRADDERSPVVVLSDSVWQSQFDGDPSVIGRTVTLSKIDFTIIGVAPKTFPGLDRYVHETMYVPIGVLPRFSADGKNPLEQRDRANLLVYGRLGAGNTAAQAQAELQAIARNLEKAYPETNRNRSVLAMPEIQARFRIEPEDSAQVAILLAIAGLVLLIACANVASLLLARARARSREIAIRLAIGAGRARLFRQLFTESMLLSLAGGAAGLLLALAGIQFFSSIRLPTGFPVWLVTRLDLRVLIFCAAASVLSGIVFGIAPAWHTLKPDLSGTLKAGDSALSGKRRRFQIRNLLVAGQVALSMVLLLVSGLLVKDFANLAHFRAGFRTDHLLIMLLDPSLVRYQETQARAFYRQLVDRVEQLPGVRAAMLAQHVPLGLTGTKSDVMVEGYELRQGQRSLSILSNIVDSRYFTVMQIPVVNGRMFDDRDTASSPPVAIVNETMAKSYWPHRNPIGGRIQIGKQNLEVVGIAKNIKYRDLSEQPQPFLYLPFAQQYSGLMTLHVESAVDPATLAAPVLAEIRRLDPGTPVEGVQTMDRFFEEGALFGNRLITQLVTVIGVFGLLLSVGGLYGVIAYSVSRRTREIGIRIAVGADPGSVARLVLGQGMKLTAVGVAIGLALSLLASRLLGSLLVGVSARDPFVYTAVPLLLAAISLLACYIPARRAARVDPLVALRQD